MALEEYQIRRSQSVSLIPRHLDLYRSSSVAVLPRTRVGGTYPIRRTISTSSINTPTLAELYMRSVSNFTSYRYTPGKYYGYTRDWGLLDNYWYGKSYYPYSYRPYSTYVPRRHYSYVDPPYSLTSLSWYYPSTDPYRYRYTVDPYYWNCYRDPYYRTYSDLDRYWLTRWNTDWTSRYSRYRDYYIPTGYYGNYGSYRPTYYYYNC